jgi:outer membrane protein assembly factor BamB
LDLALFLLLSTALLVLGTLVAIGPRALDIGLNTIRDVGVISARFLGRLHTNLSFLEWDEGNRHNIWIISSAMALASFALTPFLFPRRPVIRVAVAFGLFIGVALAATHAPWAAAYGNRYPLGALIVFYSPVIALAVWHLLESLVGRIQIASNASTVITRGQRLLGCVPAVLAVALFVSPNHLEQQEMLTRRLVCLDTATGKRVWHTDVFTTLPEAKSPLNSHATPTPSVAEDRIVVAFGVGIATVGLDGQLLWSKTFPNWFGNSIYGAGSSPVADKEAVFVTSDREYEAPHPSHVTAYSLRTGRELWSQTPEFAHDGYATPVVYHDGYQELLLTHTSRTLVAYDVADGTVAWRLPTPVPQPVPSVVAEEGKLYVTGGKGDDGYTAAYQLRQHAAPEQLWISRRNPGDIPSPVVYKGRLYTISSTGIMVSYDAESGQIIWRRRIGSGLGSFYASLVAADDKVYAASSNGATFVIAADDRFRLLSESSVPEEVFASPAFAAHCLMLRTVSALYCIGRRE